MTNDPDDVTNLVHLPPLGYSDHDCLMWDLCCEAVHKQSKINKSYNYFKGDYDSLTMYFQEMDWSSRFKGHDIDYNYSLVISSAVDIYIPRVSKANKTKPYWWSKKLSVTVCNKKRLFSKWKTTRANSDYQIYAQQETKLSLS